MRKFGLSKVSPLVTSRRQGALSVALVYLPCIKGLCDGGGGARPVT